MRVAFFNELDTYAELQGLNTGDIIAGVCLDARIGQGYNNPSFGYGGYCLPKDTRQLRANFLPASPHRLIGAIVDANETRMDHIAAMILKRNPGVVGIYRLVMKAGSTTRAAAIAGVMRRLQARGTPMVIYEPLLQAAQHDGIPVVHDLAEFKRVADVIVAKPAWRRNWPM